jgi:predicted nucleotidyltransferase
LAVKPILTLVRPLDPLLLDILRRIDVATRALGIDYFIVGALARDLILLHVYGKDTGRATRDVDIGIAINDWQKLAQLRANLVESGHFVAQAKVAHRLYYLSPASGLGIPLDLLPFGALEGANATIAWPPDWAIVMNESGFSQAYATRLSLQAANGLRLPVAALPALAVLKLLAWQDRHLQSAKDASDFLLILRLYHDAGNLDRLYEIEPALLQACAFDPEQAGAMLLGKDALVICNHTTADVVRSILADGVLRQRLQDQMNRAMAMGCGAGTLDAVRFLDAFAVGFGMIAN